MHQVTWTVVIAAKTRNWKTNHRGHKGTQRKMPLKNRSQKSNRTFTGLEIQNVLIGLISFVFLCG